MRSSRSSTSRTGSAGAGAAERRQDACNKLLTEQAIYNNQWLEAVPAVRVSNEDKDNAWEYQITHQPTEDFHKVGILG